MKGAKEVVVASMVVRETEEVIVVGAEEQDMVIVGAEDKDVVVAVAEDKVPWMGSWFVVRFAALCAVLVSVLS